MARHGNLTLTSTGVVELNAADLALSNGPRALVQGEFHIHNEGPDTVRLTLTDSGLGAGEGYPLASGARETFTHTGSLHVRCETAAGGNPVTVNFLIALGA